MAFMLKNNREEFGPFDTKEEALLFMLGPEVDQDEYYWIDDLDKIKKLSKSDQK